MTMLTTRRTSSPRFLTALVLLLAIAQVLTLLPVQVAQAQSVPTLSVSPSSGLAGTAVTLAGSGFLSGGSKGSILWDGAVVQSFDIPRVGSFSLAFSIPASAAAGAHSITACAGSPCFTGEFALQASASFTVEPGLAGMPLELQRRAVQFIEEMRGSELAPGWEQARPGGVARPLYRPDIEGVAYYEVDVVAPTSTQPGVAAANLLLPAGFIVLSNGEHDFPIAHWSSDSEAPTRALQRLATGNQQGTPAKFFKLDALSYAAEDAKGNLVAQLGQQPAKISGIDKQVLDQPRTLSSAEWTPQPGDDSGQSQGQGKLDQSGPQPPAGLKQESWASWDELKAGYAASYGVFTEDLRREAAHDWAIERNAARFGEGLRKGDIYNLALLPAGGAALAAAPTVSLSGTGAAMVTGALLPDGTTYRITVNDAVPGQTLPLDVKIDYADGRSETVKFAVIGATSLLYLPVVTKGGGAAAAQGEAGAGLQGEAGAELQGAWGPWTYFWAGGHGDQRLYDQMAAGSSPNTSGCWSGCGGTAWAMLFGWADNQAALNHPTWKNRKGIYRENGGYGADAVAPRNQDTGVRNMTWEIRNYIGTFCAFGSGATAPWDMSNAWRYLDGRTGTRLRTSYNSFGIHSGDLREKARDSIRLRGTPAIIGTGWLSHYPLAYGYAWRKRTVNRCFIFCWEETEYARFFYVNQGWGGREMGWVSAGTWFAGEILP